MIDQHTTLHRGRHAAPEDAASYDAVTMPLRVPGITRRRRGVVAAASVAVLAAASGGAYVLGAHSTGITSVASATPVAPVGAVAAAPVRATPVAAPTTAAPATVARAHKAVTTVTKRATRTTPSHHTSPRSTSSSSAGCGQRAVTAGVFDPACSEYQGYLDPGISAGRAPSSGDIQRQACRDGELPGVDPSQC